MLAEVRDDALSALQDVLEWSLTPAHWEDVEELLDRMGDVLDLAGTGQRDALIEATVALEQAGPVRLTKIDKSAVPVPGQVRDRVNHLVHELTRPEQADDSRGVPGASA
jgi:hypothetical protein